ncbi:MAG TPA: hypothetical protein VGR92_11545 [Steroidobacteraceae bacterium]|nr:hypothetical protein [Steroidobacteraceae bacterium]
MRAMLGITIALPVAAAFCLVYLTMLALEALRDVTFSQHGARGVSSQHEGWTSPARVAT